MTSQEVSMAIYLVKHPDPTFKGFFAGLDFSNGTASTNSLEDARAAAKAVEGKVSELVTAKSKEADTAKAEVPTQTKTKKK
jgi:hypothetical protein